MKKEINKKLKQFANGSKSLAAVTGYILAANSVDGALEQISLSAFSGDLTMSASESYRKVVVPLAFTGSTDSDDLIFFRSDNNPNGSLLFSSGYGSDAGFVSSGSVPQLYSRGSSIDGTKDAATDHAYFVASGGSSSPWDSDQTDVAVGFHTGDSRFGYVNINWVTATKTIEIKKIVIETSTGVAAQFAAVPEPADYATALGLGAAGLAYYRNRKNIKQRVKIKSNQSLNN